MTERGYVPRRRGYPSRSLLVFLAGVGSMVGACGGGGGSATLTKGAFIKQADAICAPTTAAIKAIPKPTNSSTAAELTAIVQKFLATIEPTVAKLEALNGAPQDKAVLDQNLIAPNKSGDAAAHTFLDEMARANGDQAKEQAALAKFGAASQDPQEQAHDKALANYGFDACSKTNQ